MEDQKQSKRMRWVWGLFLCALVLEIVIPSFNHAIRNAWAHSFGLNLLVYDWTITVFFIILEIVQFGLFLVACRYLNWKTCWGMAGIKLVAQALVYFTLPYWLAFLVKLSGETPGLSFFGAFQTGFETLGFSALLHVFGLLLKRFKGQSSPAVFFGIGTVGLIVFRVGFTMLLQDFPSLHLAPWIFYVSEEVFRVVLLFGFCLLASLPWRREEKAALEAARQAETAPAE